MIDSANPGAVVLQGQISIINQIVDARERW